MNRRAFLGQGLTAMAILALLRRAVAAGALASELHQPAWTWLREVAAATQGLRERRLDAASWRQALATLFDRVPLPELLAAIDYPRLISRLELPADRAGFADPQLPDIEGLPRWPQCGLRVFGLARGRAIVPHGHQNMVSAHLVVEGEIRVRHYDRLADEADHLLLRPSLDRIARPGAATSISEREDNVHWLVAHSAVAYTLDFIVVDLDANQRTRWGDFVDIRAAEALGDGLIRAPRLDFDAAIGRYGKDPEV